MGAVFYDLSPEELRDLMCGKAEDDDMTYIPDCRTNEFYKIENLNDKDKQFALGFDWCTEMAVDNFFDNFLFDIKLDDSYISHFLSETVPDEVREEYEMDFMFDDRRSETRTVETYGDLIRMKLLEWIESKRNELIVGMIDENIDDE